MFISSIEYSLRNWNGILANVLFLLNFISYWSKSHDYSKVFEWRQRIVPTQIGAISDLKILKAFESSQYFWHSGQSLFGQGWAYEITAPGQPSWKNMVDLLWTWLIWKNRSFLFSTQFNLSVEEVTGNVLKGWLKWLGSVGVSCYLVTRKFIYL